MSVNQFVVLFRELNVLCTVNLAKNNAVLSISTAQDVLSRTKEDSLDHVTFNATEANLQFGQLLSQ